MEILEAAERWRATWEAAWPRRDVDAVAKLYSDNAEYRSSPFRDPEIGGAQQYVARVFAEESEIRCWFGNPMVLGSRACVEWWATLIEEGQQQTLAGATVLTFDEFGWVVDHVDYWMQAPGHVEPFRPWGGRLQADHE